MYIMYDPHDSAIHRSQHKMTGPATAQKTKRVQAVARFTIRATSKVKAILRSWNGRKSPNTLLNRHHRKMHIHMLQLQQIEIYLISTKKHGLPPDLYPETTCCHMDSNSPSLRLQHIGTTLVPARPSTDARTLRLEMTDMWFIWV